MIAAAVVDASVAIKWVLPEPGSEQAHAIRPARLHAPALLRVECGSALWRRSRQGEFSRADAREMLAIIVQAPVLLAPDESLASAALELSFQLDHPIYDCLYVALARYLNLPLITADARLLRSSARSERRGCEVLSLAKISLI